MKPANFEYTRAATVEEALSLLESYGEQAKILAGGQSLIALMNLRLARPEQLIDIKGIKELTGITENGDTIRIGALTKHSEVETNEVIKNGCPLLSWAAQFVGHPQIRHRGTIGGSVCHADPAAQFPTIITALDATMVAKGPDGTREIPASEFFLGYLTTSLAENEVLTEIKVPKITSGQRWSFQEMSDVDGAVPVACVAALLDIDASGACTKANIAVGGVGATSIRPSEAEEFLAGKKLDDQVIEEASQLIEGALEPETDIRFTADYKAAVAKAMFKRAIKEALERK